MNLRTPIRIGTAVIQCRYSFSPETVRRAFPYGRSRGTSITELSFGLSRAGLSYRFTIESMCSRAIWNSSSRLWKEYE